VFQLSSDIQSVYGISTFSDDTHYAIDNVCLLNVCVIVYIDDNFSVIIFTKKTLNSDHCRHSIRHYVGSPTFHCEIKFIFVWKYEFATILRVLLHDAKLFANYPFLTDIKCQIQYFHIKVDFLLSIYISTQPWLIDNIVYIHSYKETIHLHHIRLIYRTKFHINIHAFTICIE